MPDGIGLALSAPGLPVLVAVSILAGLVYGFAGFGSALIVMPVATVFLAPHVAVGAFFVSTLGSIFVVLPRAWRDCDPRASLYMVLVSSITLPLGLLVLRHADATPLRWAVLAAVTVTLIALLTGWRYVGRPTRLTRGAIAAATGFVGGAVGLNGPVIVVFNLAGSDPVSRVRANNIVFLTLNSILLLVIMMLLGMLATPAMWLGLMLLVPYGLGLLAGQALFVPRWERFYRAAAYAIVAAAVLVGLPVWS